MATRARSAVAIVAHVSLILTLAGCGGGAATTQAPQANPSPESELVFASTGGPAVAAQIAVLTKWAAPLGIKVTSVSGTCASLLAKMLASRNGSIDFDLVGCNDQTVAAGRAQGVLHTVDPRYLTNLKYTDQEFTLPRDAFGSPAVAVRGSIYPVGLAYNTAVFQKNGWNPPGSWTDLYNPRYARCVTPLAPSGMAAYMAMLNYVTSKSYSDIGPTIARFQPIAKQVPAFPAVLGTAEQLLQNGTSCLIPDQEGRTYALQQNGAPVAFVKPKEGLALLSGDMMIPKNAPHPIAAQMAINELLSTEAGQTLLEQGLFATCNLQVKSPPSGLASQLLLATNFRKAKLTSIPITAYDSLDEWSQKWNQMAGGSS